MPRLGLLPKDWDLCLYVQFLQIVDPPHATEEKSEQQKRISFFVKLPVLFLPELEWRCESVSVCDAALSSGIKSSDCEIIDLLSVFVAAHRKSTEKMLFWDYIYFLFRRNKSYNIDRLHRNVSVYKRGSSSSAWGLTIAGVIAWSFIAAGGESRKSAGWENDDLCLLWRLNWLSCEHAANTEQQLAHRFKYPHSSKFCSIKGPWWRGQLNYWTTLGPSGSIKKGEFCL